MVILVLLDVKKGHLAHEWVKIALKCGLCGYV